MRAGPRFAGPRLAGVRRGKRSPHGGGRLRLFSWSGYLITIAAMLLFASLPGLLYSGQEWPRLLVNRYTGWYFLYWAVAAGLFCGLVAFQRYRTFDRPVRTLSAAMDRVARGDFSLYLEPLHTGDKLDYIDLMFLDFNKMVAELGSIETLKNDFVSNVSHELKTPLAVIRSYAVLLQGEGLAPEERREYQEEIAAATDRLTALVTNILRLNRLEHQEIPPAREPCDLCAQLSACILGFEREWEQKGIRLEASLEDRATLPADGEMLEIVWNNLLSNALKFTEPGGSVTVAQTSDEAWVTVTVTDTGRGMDGETVRHIFEKFYQGDPSHSGEGNGLGLALVQRVVEQHGGTVSVSSRPGEGSAFTVRLPAEGTARG